MRVLAASFMVFFGLGGLATLAACSDANSGTGGAGGAGGSDASGGKASAGAPNGVSSGGAASDCTFSSDACQTCIAQKCGAQVGACAADSATCLPALDTLTVCACDPRQTTDACQAAFVTAASTLAEKLTNCYTLNCMAACQ